VASAFNALLSNVRDRNRAMASMAQARAGIQVGKEERELQRGRESIASQQLAEETRRTTREGRQKRRGLFGGVLGGLLAPMAMTAAAATPLGAILIPAAGAYLGSKALTGKTASKFAEETGMGASTYKYKEINEADIANLSGGYFLKGERETIRSDIDKINTLGTSMNDMFKASKESVAQQMALMFATPGIKDYFKGLTTKAGAGKGAELTETFKDWKTRMAKGGIAAEDLTEDVYKTMIMNQPTQLLDPYASPVATTSPVFGGAAGGPTHATTFAMEETMGPGMGSLLTQGFDALPGIANPYDVTNMPVRAGRVWGESPVGIARTAPSADWDPYTGTYGGRDVTQIVQQIFGR